MIENQDEIVEAPARKFNPDDPEDLALVARAMGYKPSREKIIGVLDQLQEALGLNQSQRPSEFLYEIVARAFDDNNSQELRDTLHRSYEEGRSNYKEGRYCDMRGPITDKLLAALDEYQ